MSKFIALMYHSLREHPTGRYSLSFSEFNAQVAWLRSEEFIVEGFAELGQRLMQGGFPERYVVITFDDGHDSDLRAAEILRKVGAQATFFLTKEFCHTRKGFLDANGIKELSTLCSVGSHGVTHSLFERYDRGTDAMGIGGKQKMVGRLAGQSRQHV